MDIILDLFRDSGFVNFVTFGLSAVAILLSLMSYLGGKGINKRLLEIEEKRDAKDVSESKTASIRASKGGTKREPTIVIQNTGSGTARNIQLKFDGQAMADHPIYFMSTAPEVLGPDSATELRFVASDQTPAPRIIRICWSDDTGEHGEYESTL